MAGERLSPTEYLTVVVAEVEIVKASTNYAGMSQDARTAFDAGVLACAATTITLLFKRAEGEAP